MHAGFGTIVCCSDGGRPPDAVLGGTGQVIWRGHSGSWPLMLTFSASLTTLYGKIAAALKDIYFEDFVSTKRNANVDSQHVLKT